MGESSCGQDLRQMGSGASPNSTLPVFSPPGQSTRTTTRTEIRGRLDPASSHMKPDTHTVQELFERDADDPAALEHLVAMRRVAPSVRLDQQVVEDAVHIGETAALGSTLAHLHQHAARTSDHHGADTVRSCSEQRVSVIRRAPEGVIAAGKVDAVVGFLRQSDSCLRTQCS